MLQARTALQDRSDSIQTLLSSSCRLAIAEHLGVSYHVTGRPAGAGLERLNTPRGAALLWPSFEEHAAHLVSAAIDTASLASIPIFAALVDDRVSGRLLEEYGGSWSRAASIGDVDGNHFASIWSTPEGDVFLPFAPDQVCDSYWSERYRPIAQKRATRYAQRRAMHAYYQMRGLLPRSSQIWLRRRYARIQMRTPFPRWPIETALHDFFDLFMAILAEVADAPVPRIATWPDGHTWALVLTHDVETSDGLGMLDPILDQERALGFRSSWNFIPRRYEVGDDRIRRLRTEGFEVGVHGLHHDGRDLASLAGLQERLPSIRTAAEHWNAVGFRSPATHRDWDLMPLLGFDYDSSYPDTDPFEPQGGGCCTWLPFFNGEMVELPLTMPQDHTLFAILRHSDGTAWIDKVEFLRGRGGMALIDTHPDYLLEERIGSAYRRLLEHCAGDATAWKPLPQDVSAWWRRRAASRIERTADAWVVTGPAAGEAAVELVDGIPWR